MKKGYVVLILFGLFAVYLIWMDFGLVKKLVEYNVPDDGLGFLSVPDGFKISVAAKGLDNPRVMTFDPKGRMLVSETKTGRVSVLEDKDQDGDFETKYTLIENLRYPHGLAFYTDPEPSRQGGSYEAGDNKVTYLYIAETHRVTRRAYNIDSGKLGEIMGQNIADLPVEGRHFTRTIAFGPNTRDIDLVGEKVFKGLYSKDKLYISVGSSCDVCVEDTWKRAAILESDPEGTVTAEFAGGLRNAVFFTFHPETGEMWATEMGRDNLGDDLPPDEINIVKPAGPEQKFGARRFGWPFCYGNKVKDETFRPEKVERIDMPTDCRQTDAPAIEIPAHSAPLGLAFITSGKWPSQWKNDLLVAYHGSWNRSEPTGYKIVRFKVDKKGRVSETADFITGWLSDPPAGGKEKIYGRPVDLKFGHDEVLYISDDAAGVIYKLESKI